MDTNDSTFKCSRDTADFFEWLEEPFANLITLCHFKTFAKEYLKEVEEFIKSSPDEYKLGKVFFDKNFNRWREWRDNKIQICNRTKEINEWVDYVKNNKDNPDINELDNLFTKMCMQITS